MGYREEDEGVLGRWLHDVRRPSGSAGYSGRRNCKMVVRREPAPLTSSRDVRE
jgi:hypothetical protein